MKEINLSLMGNRMLSRRKELALTLEDVGGKIGVAPSTIQRYERGLISRPKMPVIQSIAGVLDTDIEWLTGESDTISAMPSNAFPAQLYSNVRVPIIGRVAAGIACHAEENIEGYEYVPADELSFSETYVYLRVRGDSMSPLIQEDDLVLVRCQDMVDNGTYAVVIIDNEDGVVKKVYIHKDRIELHSENPYYPPRIFKGEECSRVRIFGKVIECKRKF